MQYTWNIVLESNLCSVVDIQNFSRVAEQEMSLLCIKYALFTRYAYVTFTFIVFLRLTTTNS